MIAAKEKCPYCEDENYHEMIRTDGIEAISIKKKQIRNIAWICSSWN